ncbi:MAG: hypothetical protein V1862_02700 [Methanobacteriota archaeon]
MGLKVWSLVLVSVILIVLLIGFLAGFLKILDLGLLVFAILVLLASFLTITRKDPLSKIPTALEIEKTKRKIKVEESGIRIAPEDKL